MTWLASRLLAAAAVGALVAFAVLGAAFAWDPAAAFRLPQAAGQAVLLAAPLVVQLWRIG